MTCSPSTSAPHPARTTCPEPRARWCRSSPSATSWTDGTRSWGGCSLLTDRCGSVWWVRVPAESRWCSRCAMGCARACANAEANPDRLSFELFTPGAEVLPKNPPRVRAAFARVLAERGVRVHRNAWIDRVTTGVRCTPRASPAGAGLDAGAVNLRARPQISLRSAHCRRRRPRARRGVVGHRGRRPAVARRFGAGNRRQRLRRRASQPGVHLPYPASSRPETAPQCWSIPGRRPGSSRSGRGRRSRRTSAARCAGSR